MNLDLNFQRNSTQIKHQLSSFSLAICRPHGRSFLMPPFFSSLYSANSISPTQVALFHKIRPISLVVHPLSAKDVYLARFSPTLDNPHKTTLQTAHQHLTDSQDKQLLPQPLLQVSCQVYYLIYYAFRFFLDRGDHRDPRAAAALDGLTSLRLCFLSKDLVCDVS